MLEANVVDTAYMRGQHQAVFSKVYLACREVWQGDAACIGPLIHETIHGDRIVVFSGG